MKPRSGPIKSQTPRLWEVEAIAKGRAASQEAADGSWGAGRGLWPCPGWGGLGGAAWQGRVGCASWAVCRPGRSSAHLPSPRPPSLQGRTRHGTSMGPRSRFHAVPEHWWNAGIPGHKSGGSNVVCNFEEAVVASALLVAGSRLGDLVHGYGVRLLPGLEGAGGLYREGPGAAGTLCGAAGSQLGLATLVLWRPPDGLGPGGDHPDQWGSSGHHCVLVPSEPHGCPPHVPLPGLDGDGHDPELLRLAG